MSVSVEACCGVYAITSMCKLVEGVTHARMGAGPH